MYSGLSRSYLKLFNYWVVQITHARIVGSSASEGIGIDATGFVLQQLCSPRAGCPTVIQTYDVGLDDRMFVITKDFLHWEMHGDSGDAGVRQIRIHGYWGLRMLSA